MSNQLTPGQDALDLSDAPGADQALDDLFPNPETFGGGNVPPAAQPEPQAPPAPQKPEFFVATYKDKDAAEKGIRDKDALIEKLRAQAISRDGVDPVTGRPTQPQQPQPVNYATDRRRYFRDIVEAVRKASETGNEEDYADVQAKFIQDQLGPAVPLFLENSRINAVNSLEEKLPGVKEFLRSEKFAKLKERYPVFANAVESAENDFRYLGSLPEMYEIAYTASQGLSLPELLKGATSSTPSTQGANPQPRPTLTNSTPAPPQPADAIDLSTPEGRKAYIEAAVRRGVDKIPIR